MLAACLLVLLAVSLVSFDSAVTGRGGLHHNGGCHSGPSGGAGAAPQHRRSHRLDILISLPASSASTPHRGVLT